MQYSHAANLNIELGISNLLRQDMAGKGMLFVHNETHHNINRFDVWHVLPMILSSNSENSQVPMGCQDFNRMRKVPWDLAWDTWVIWMFGMFGMPCSNLT